MKSIYKTLLALTWWVLTLIASALAGASWAAYNHEKFNGKFDHLKTN